MWLTVTNAIAYCGTEFIYCDQPIVSETTRRVSDDFIKTIDDQGQNARGFYV